MERLLSLIDLMVGGIDISFVVSYCCDVISIIDFLVIYLPAGMSWEVSWYFETVEAQEMDLSLRSEGSL